MRPSRRELLSLAVAGGLAGCLLDGDGGTDTTDGESETAAFNRAEKLIQFDGTVSDAIRQRAIRAYARTEQLLDEPLQAEVTVKLERIDLSTILESASAQNVRSDPNAPGTGTPLASGRSGYGKQPIERLVEVATHRDEWPDVGFSYHGRYSSDSRTLRVTVPESTDIALAALRLFAPTEVPDDALDEYPNDALFAHEFTHAIQYDRTDPPNSHPRTAFRDQEMAKSSILEGAADYVFGDYRANCLDDTYDTCATLGYWYTVETIPSFALSARMPYLNGAILTYYLLEDGGWEAVWEAHENPPETAWAAMFPDAYVQDGIEIDSPSPKRPPPEEWEVLDSARLGVNALYEKLFQLDVVSRLPEDGKLSQPVTDTVGHEYMFRSDLLQGWRGDEFVGYEQNDPMGRAYRWTIRMASAREAAALADAIRNGYDENGQLHDGTRVVDARAVAVEQDSEEITLWMALNVERLATFRDAF